MADQNRRCISAAITVLSCVAQGLLAWGDGADDGVNTRDEEKLEGDSVRVLIVFLFLALAARCGSSQLPFDFCRRGLHCHADSNRPCRCRTRHHMLHSFNRSRVSLRR